MSNHPVLEIIKTRNIFLKEGQISDEIVLEDTKGDGNMYFTFCLKYVSGERNGSTHFNIRDAHHADIVIEIKPTAITTLEKPFKLGTYAKNKDLSVNFIVQPRDANNNHNITITFYTNK